MNARKFSRLGASESTVIESAAHESLDGLGIESLLSSEQEALHPPIEEGYTLV